MADVKIVFGLCPAIPEQGELITKHCFGDCGKILLGMITDDKIGLCLAPCREENCPYEERRMGLGSIHWGDTVWMRKLKECGE